MGDILRSVLVLAVAVLAVVWIGGGFDSDPVAEPETVDVEAVARRAADTATYPLLAPSALPAGWRATQARWDPTGQQWHLGLLTDDEAYVGLEQARGVPIAELVESFLGSAEPDGEQVVGGTPWRVYVDTATGRTALLSSDGGVTTMVLGSPPRATLVAFAETLRPTPGGGSQPSAIGARADEPAVPGPRKKRERPHPVSIAALVEHEYDGRGLRLGRSLGDFGAYTRHYVTYRSEGLRISGILNIPAGKGPFPALVLNHGYIDPAEYVNGQGLAREQDYLARRGFLVLHTDYRNHAGSGSDPGNDLRLRLGYTVDVVNAVRALRRSSLPVDDDRVGLLGRSMGGGVTYNALVARPGLVDAAVVYAPVSSLAAQNFERWIRDDPDDDGLSARILERYGSPERNPEFWRDVSPRPFFDRITEPVLIHHGTADSTCPPAWSRATLRAMRAADVRARLLAYPGEEHAFVPQWEESMQRTTDFLRTHLRG